MIGTQEGWLKGKTKSADGWFPETYVAVAEQKVAGGSLNGFHMKATDQIQVADTVVFNEIPDVYSNLSE